MIIKRIAAVLLLLSMVFGLFGCRGTNGTADETTAAQNQSESSAADTTTTGEKDGETEADTDDTDADSQNDSGAAVDSSADALKLSPKAVWSENTTVTKNMFVFYYNSYYRYYLQSNSDRLASLGLDPKKSLSSQQQSEKYNWQQYFTLEVYRQLREMIALADSAREAGVKLDGKDKKDIDEEIATYKAQATKAGYSEKEFFEKTYGKGVTETDIRAATELRYLANKYYSKVWEEYDFSESECSDYYNKNRDKFVYFDCITNTVPKEDADALLKCKDKESFLEAMRDVITKNNFGGDYEGYKDSIDELLQKKTVKRVSGNSENETVKWALQKDRKPYDVYSEKYDENRVTVTMILPCDGEAGKVTDVLYRDEEPLRNVMCMIFGDSESTKGLVKANTIYKNWQEEPTEDRFGSLMIMYDGSKTENIYRSLLNSKVESWLFDSARKDGDCEVIEEDGGAYLVYKLPDGEATWLYEVREFMKDEAYGDRVQSAIDKFPTEYDADIVYNVIEVEVN